MFKASLQRHALLSRAVCGQLSTTAAARSLRTQHFPQARGFLLKPANTPIRTFTASRLYLSEATAEQSENNASEPGNSSETIKRFSELGTLGVHPTIVRSITEGMRYEDMTDVQSLTINPALRGLDLVAQAKTGTGKTLAFLVPVIQRLLQEEPSLATRRRPRPSADNIRAIVMSPTRELADQIAVEAAKLVKSTGLVVQTAVGGTRKREALMRMQRQGCDILVATPGRLHDLLSDPSSNVAAPNLRALVLDEADRMLDVGFSDEIQRILSLLPSVNEVDRQTLLFSATIPRDVVHLARSLVKTDNFDFIQTIQKDEVPTHERVPQHLAVCNSYENFFPTIMEIADQAKKAAKTDPSLPPFKAMVFFSNTATVQFASQVFSSTSFGGLGGIPIYEIHSKLTQNERTRASDSFRRAKTGLFFTSDVTARGMDFPGVTHVIQVGLPPDREQYIHRLGRTGRAGASGEGWLLLTQSEIPEARDRLPGLPIKPNTSIESAKHDATTEPSDEVAQYFNDVERGYKNSSLALFKAVYMAMLTQASGRRVRKADVVENLNNWCLNGLKQDRTPAIPPNAARARGVADVRGIRLGHDDEFSNRDDRRIHEFGQTRGSHSGFGGSRHGSNSFEARFNVREDRGRSSRGSKPQRSFF
ncbi:P-loop containing nucleoside triphosphate hydrolase protein [Xylariales sp. PMI_506]|nr:P-loop containing nucleoside triphosphate hydrolase protein [Xylariales sp. PMI_506]